MPPLPATTVREASPAELAAAAELFDAYRQFYNCPPDLGTARAFMQARLAQRDSWVALAWRGEQAVGLCQCYPVFSSTAPRPGPAMLLNDLYVRADARGGGVARALMRAAEAHARAQGCVSMELSTARDNHRAQALYEGEGWVRDAVFCVYGKRL